MFCHCQVSTSRLEGPAALDVLVNFEERWRLQAGDKAAFLYSLEEGDFLEGNTLEDQEDGWVAQVPGGCDCTLPLPLHRLSEASPPIRVISTWPG